MTAVTAEMLADYAATIKGGYANWRGRTERLAHISGTIECLGNKKAEDAVAEFMVDFEPGSSYIRVVTMSYGSRTAHSFIVKKAGKFPIGTILKAASWKAPATNFARGNILTRDFARVRWTGVI